MFAAAFFFLVSLSFALLLRLDAPVPETIVRVTWRLGGLCLLTSAGAAIAVTGPTVAALAPMSGIAIGLKIVTG